MELLTIHTNRLYAQQKLLTLLKRMKIVIILSLVSSTYCNTKHKTWFASYFQPHYSGKITRKIAKECRMSLRDTNIILKPKRTLYIIQSFVYRKPQDLQ